MALTVGDRTVRPLTADEVLRMVELGVLAEGERVELLRGVLTTVSPKSPAHSLVKTRLVEWLAPGAAERGFAVRVEDPLIVPDATSLPEPDIAVVGRGGPANRHPTTAIMVIEVAASSLTTDTTIKPALYAAAGVPEYWVVDVPGRRVHVFSAPDAAGFTSLKVVGVPALIAPVAVGLPSLDLDGLFAGL